MFHFSQSYYVILPYSCSQNDKYLIPSKVETQANYKIIEFQGERVRLQEDISEQAFLDYLKFTQRNYSARTTGDNPLKTSNFKRDWSKISMSEIYVIIGQGMKIYPFSKEDFTDEQVTKIQKDILSVKDKEDANSKKSVISDYYNVLLAKYLDMEIEKRIKKNRIKDVYPEGTSQLEKDFASQDPLAAYCFGEWGKNQSESMTTEVFGCYESDNKQLNAFKHAAWNALGVQELVQITRAKHNSLGRIKTLACVHEYVENTSNGTWVLPDDVRTAMDLHNNLVGRTYMCSQITTFLGLAGNIPSNNSIKNHLSGLNYLKIDNSGNVMNLSGSDIFTMP